MEVREVDLAKMMQLVEECSKEGSREGEEEPKDDTEGGVFGLGLLTVKRGIMPGWKVKIFKILLYTILKIETTYRFRNSVVWGG